MDFSWSPDLNYILLLFALFVLPRALQRFRLPAAVTSVALGLVAGMGFGLFTDDHTVELLATFGIVALFLFAGLDVEVTELRRGARVLIQHVVIGGAAIAGGTYVLLHALGLDVRSATLVALAILTPSTGFILDSLAGLSIGDEQRFWIRSKAIAAELVALGVLFVVLQSQSAEQLGISVVVLLSLVLLLPIAFRMFAANVVPYAPRSEFAFLLMLAIIAASITRRLGVYYLVGAFVVGLVARQFRTRLPAVTSDEMLHAVEMFAQFFVPFYFFRAGLHVAADDFSLRAVLLGVAFLAIGLPLRVLLVAVHRRLALRESWTDASHVGVAMLPTMVFTLVIAGILRDRFAAPPAIFGGLVIYTLANALVPGWVLSRKDPSLAKLALESPGAPDGEIPATSP